MDAMMAIDTQKTSPAMMWGARDAMVRMRHSAWIVLRFIDAPM